MKSITVLGSTGSVGMQTLDFLSQHPDSFEIYALTVGSKADALVAQALKYRPKIIAIRDTTRLDYIKQAVAHLDIAVYGGADAICDIASHTVDMVVSAIVGSDGLAPTVSAIKGGNTIALANKESLVCAGHMVMELARKKSVDILPVDSEHSALFQVYNAPQKSSIKTFGLTASGGALRDKDTDFIYNATPEHVLKHPNWDMGAKITVDCAGLMNKGFELIEACHLFDVDEQQVSVIVHPQSIVHAFISYADGTTIAHLGYPDMRTPISVALSYPNRMACGVDMLDFAKVARLDFYDHDPKRFPALECCRQAFCSGGGACAILNGANEVAVDAFLNHRISFGGIMDTVYHTLDSVSAPLPHSLEDFQSIHNEAISIASLYLKTRG